MIYPLNRYIGKHQQILILLVTKISAVVVDALCIAMVKMKATKIKVMCKHQYQEIYSFIRRSTSPKRSIRLIHR